MKALYTLIGIAVLLALGFIAGRQNPPTPEAAPSSDATSSERSPRKATRAKQTATQNAATVSPTDLDGLLKLVDAQMPFETSTRLRAALGDLGPASLEGLLTRLLQSEETEPGYYQLRLSLLNHFVAQDPFRALDFLLVQDDKNFKTSSLSIIIQAAAKINLAAARDAVAQIKDKSLKKIGESALLLAPDDATSEELLDLLSKQKNQNQNHFYPGWGGSAFFHHGLSYGNGNGSALAKLAEKDLSAAENYARNFKNQTERDNAYSQIASVLAKNDPQGALDWAKGFDTSEGRSKHLSAAILAIAAKDPEFAAAQLDDLNNLQLKNNNISSIAHYWAQTDPQAAIAWIGTLPAGQSKTQAYQIATNLLASTDPLAAIKLAQDLPGNSRQQLMPCLLDRCQCLAMPRVT